MFKLLFIISHGQSKVERGFSTNSEAAAPNMKSETLMKLRTIHGAIMSANLAEFCVTKELLAHYRLL